MSTDAGAEYAHAAVVVDARNGGQQVQHAAAVNRQLLDAGALERVAQG